MKKGMTPPATSGSGSVNDHDSVTPSGRCRVPERTAPNGTPFSNARFRSSVSRVPLTAHVVSRELTPEAVLTRMPRGYAESHPAAGWLRFQSFTASRDMPEREVLSPRLPEILARDFAALVPLVRWLNQAIGYSSRDRRF